LHLQKVRSTMTDGTVNMGTPQARNMPLPLQDENVYDDIWCGCNRISCLVIKFCLSHCTEAGRLVEGTTEHIFFLARSSLGRVVVHPQICWSIQFNGLNWLTSVFIYLYHSLVETEMARCCPALGCRRIIHANVGAGGGRKGWRFFLQVLRN
jgi:hypothetical protein